MKTCTNCKIEKPLSEFGRTGKKQYVRSNCKQCHAAKAKETRERKKKNGYYYLYYIPEEHYIGITNHIEQRMSKHKHLGKIIDDYEIICKFKNPMQAHLYETYMHCIGYNGFRP